MQSVPFITLSVTAIGLAASSAAAQSFTDRAAFEAAASGAGIALGLESFETLPLSSGSAELDVINAPSFDLAGVNEGFDFIPPLSVLGLSGPGGTFPTDGVQHVNVGSLFNSGLNNDVVITITFDSPQNAIFLDFTDLLGLDNAPNPRAILSTNAGDAITVLDGQGTDPLLSAGFVSLTGFTEVTFRSTAGDSFGIDNVAFGVIPAPGAAGLLALAGLAATRRRRA